MDFCVERLREIQIEMFKEFLKICQKYNLSYFLINGSCLGAVKYGGFIPWDDDIDIGMFRDDYEKFIQIAQKELPEHIFLQSLKTEKDYLSGFAKLRNSQTTFIEKSGSNLNINHGVYIDIFPLDGYKKSLITNFKIKLFKNIIGTGYAAKKSSYKRKIFICIKKHFNINLKELAYKLENIAKKYVTENAEYIRSFFGAWEDKEIHKKDVFGVGTEADFEGIKVTIPEKYDEYLTKLYGCYKEDVAKEKQVSHHYCDVIDLDKSYKEYLK